MRSDNVYKAIRQFFSTLHKRMITTWLQKSYKNRGIIEQFAWDRPQSRITKR